VRGGGASRSGVRVVVTAGLMWAAGGPAPAAAQQTGLLVLEAPSGTEAMAYGYAPWLFSRGAELLFQQPALLRRAGGAAASFQRYGGEGTLVSLAGAGSFQGGGFAAGIQYFGGGALDVTELAGTIGYGRRVLGLDVGAAVKYVEEALGDDRDRGVAFDAGIAREVGPIAVALAVRDVGSDLRVDDGATELELPTRGVAGVSTRSFPVGPLDMFLTSQVTWRRDGEIVPAGGLEVSYWPVIGYTFRLRAGIQRVVEDERSPFTLGAAFTADDITVEYAFQAFEGEGDAHRFGLRWR